MNEFFQRLKQRKLVQWAIAYAAAAFALLQGIDIVAQQFGWPEGVRRGITLGLVVGFFVTLILAWYHGERGVQRVTGTELLIIGLVLALGGGFLWRFATASRAADPKTTTSPNDSRMPEPAQAIPEKSIAVLPFDNLSEEKANAYFAEGVQEEILTRLAKVADLKVISRTSTQRFKSAPDNLPEIAKQLGVMHILEGSVQKANGQVRVNVQLINAMTDAHLWADTFDRQLTEIFTVESEIAKTIADNLQAKLTGQEERAISARPTENPEAYQLYLQGRFFWNKRTTADLRKSIDYFNQALSKDPNYAHAYAGLAQTWMLFPAYNGGAPADCYPQAAAAARKALELDNTLSDAITTLASIKAVYEFDFTSAAREYERAIQLNPNDATAHHWFATDVLTFTGQQPQALAEMKRALELDPLSLIINANLGVAYVYNVRLEEAVAQLRKTIELDNNFIPGHMEYALALGLQGKISNAIAECEKAVSMNDDPNRLGLLGYLYGLAGRKDEARKTLEKLRQLRTQRYIVAYSIALASLGVNDKSEAMRWLEQSYQDRDGENIGKIRIDPLLKPLHGDPRFEALAERIVPAHEFRVPPK